METKQSTMDTNSSTLSKKCPFLLMTNAYHIPGSADDFLMKYKETLKESVLAEVQFAYFRGNIDKALALMNVIKDHPLTFYDRIGFGLLLSLCSQDYGNIKMWEEGRDLIRKCPYQNERQAREIAFWLAVNDSFLYDNQSYPNWFQQGVFDYLPMDSYPFARYCYVKYLLLASDYALPNPKSEKHEYLVLMKALAAVCEPLISQSKAEKAILAEIYTRLICAIAYHNYGRDTKAMTHIEKAFELAQPDQLLRPFAEYRQPLDFLIDQVIENIDKEALLRIKSMNKEFLNGWVKVHNMKLGRSKSTELTTREREVSRMAVYGFSNVQISERLHISLNTVKQTLKHAMGKTNCNKRSDLIKFI